MMNSRGKFSSKPDIFLIRRWLMGSNRKTNANAIDINEVFNSFEKDAPLEEENPSSGSYKKGNIVRPFLKQMVPRDLFKSVLRPKSADHQFDTNNERKIFGIKLVDNVADFSKKGQTPLFKEKDNKKLLKVTPMAIDDTNSSMTGAEKDRLAFIPTLTRQKTFAEMGLPTWLLEALDNQSITQPTIHQQEIISAILSKSTASKSVLVNAQTGTGKSLGYIIGLLAKLHKERTPTTFSPDYSAFLHLIIVPNVVLGLQLIKWIKTLVSNNTYWSENLSTVVKAMLPFDNTEHELSADIFKIGCSHILIATAAKVQEVFAKGQLNTSSIQDIIVDEVDVQLRSLSKYATFKERMLRMRHPTPTFNLLKQLSELFKDNMSIRPRTIFASATLNTQCRADLRRIGILSSKPLMIRDQSSKSSATSSCPINIKHHFRMLRNSNSIEELVDIVRTIYESHPGQTGVLFVPNNQSKQSIMGWLELANVKCQLLFDLKKNENCEQDDLTDKLLVGSELDARGWDFPRLSFVIIVDLPASPSHYVHMAGRVGRMGANGVAYTLVAGEKDFERLNSIYSMLKLTSSPFIPNLQ